MRSLVAVFLAASLALPPAAHASGPASSVEARLDKLERENARLSVELRRALTDPKAAREAAKKADEERLAIAMQGMPGERTEAPLELRLPALAATGDFAIVKRAAKRARAARNAAAAKPGPSSSATFGFLYPGLKMIGGPLIGLGGQPIIFAYPGGGSSGSSGGGSSGYAPGGTDVAITDGGTGASTAAAGFDALAPTTTRGDIIFRNATTNTRLAKGASGTVLSMGADDPQWVAQSTLDAGTIDGIDSTAFVQLGDTPTWTGAHTFSADVTLNGGTGALGFGAGETVVPADGSLNVTGNIHLPNEYYIGNGTVGYVYFGAGGVTFGANSANAFDMGVTGGFGVLTPRPAGGGKLLNHWIVDGSADVVQFTVQGHSTQTTLPFVVENSAGTDVFTVSNTGAVAASGAVVSTAAMQASQYQTQSGFVISGGTSAVPGQLEAAVSDGASAIGWILDNGATFSTAGSKLTSIQNNNVEKAAFMFDGAPLLLPTAVSIAGAHTALPVGGIVEATLTGAQTWTITETGATNGEQHTICNVDTTPDALTMDHVAGQVLLNGAADVVLGQNDCLTVYYSTALSAWLQHGATSNN